MIHWSHALSLISMLHFVAGDTMIKVSTEVEAATTDNTVEIKRMLPVDMEDESVFSDKNVLDLVEPVEEMSRSLAGNLYSLTLVAFTTYYEGACSDVIQSATISCSAGGTIGIERRDGVTCRYVSAASISCTAPISDGFTSVIVSCVGSYAVRARLLPRTFSGCRRNAAVKKAGQVMSLVQFCQNGYFYSSNCVQAPSILGYLNDGSPFCYNGSLACKAKTSSSTTCSIATGEVRIGTTQACLAPAVASGSVDVLISSWDDLATLSCLRECATLMGSCTPASSCIGVYNQCVSGCT